MRFKKSSGAMRLLIVDDEENIRRTTAVVLESMGHETVEAGDSAAAFKHLEKQPCDIAFLDLRLNGESGLDLIPELLKRAPLMDVVVFTAYASIETAVEAMRRGAVDFIPKPFTPDQIREVISRIVRARKLQNRVEELESRISSDSPATTLRSEVPAVQKAYEVARKAAGAPASILLLGESGTGKTVLARAIHESSPQKDNAFVTISCPSLSRELLESELFGHVRGAFTGATADTMGKVAAADGGTIFLDEIGELPMSIQPKLLRLLQEKEYERVGETKTRSADVRIISATNRNLEESIKAGSFREDLFYRLNVISIRMPPLRERQADLMIVADSYLKFFAMQCGKHLAGFTREAEQALRGYSWPGNLRELRNVIERSVILAGSNAIDLPDLPEKFALMMRAAPMEGIQLGGRISLDLLEGEHIRRVIEQCATMEEAAKVLGIDPATLYRKRKKMSA